MKNLIASALFVTVATFSSMAFAQQTPANNQPQQTDVVASSVNDRRGVREQTFEFRDEVVEGTRRDGGGTRLGATRLPRVTSLIRMRSHFVPEMLKSVEAL